MMIRISATFLMIFMALVLIAAQAKAECNCRCVSGRMQPICSTLTETRPRCQQTVCPIARPSIESIQNPNKDVECKERQIHNPFTGMDETKTVCQ